MAACAGDIADDELDRDEINIAFSLSEALQADEVEKFLVLYDSIPSNIGTERVNTIKEMARQLAALPKKQFELYRSKKVLSGDHSLLCYGGSWSFKGKLSRDFISDSACLKMSCGPANLKGVVVKPAVITPTKETPKEDVEETSTKKKRKKKSKKNKLQLSSSDKTVDLTEPKMEEKLLDTASGEQFSVCMNKDVVVDNSMNCEATTLTAARKNGQTDVPLHHKETEDLLSYGRKTHLKDPPFGFPPSPEKIFMSALGLLPTSSLNSADASLMEGNPSKKTCQYSETTDQEAPVGITQLKEGSPPDPVKECAKENKPIFEDEVQKPEVETINLCLETEPRQELRDNLTSTSGDFMVEAGESIDGDVSSSSAKEDEQWQSQTKRPYRKKKRELAARAGREKRQMENNQKKWEQRQHLENFKKYNNNYYYHKKIEDKKYFTHKEFEKNQGQYPGNTSNGNVQEGQASVSECVHPKSGYKENVPSQTMKESSSCNNAAAEANATSKKTFSYRDALLRNRNPKEENQYSSDSGVDANSVSSCESVIQPEAPKQVQFNHEDVTNYLMTGWQGVLDGAKKGLVSFYREGAYPGSHKRQRTKNQPKCTESQSRPPLMR